MFIPRQAGTLSLQFLLKRQRESEPQEVRHLTLRQAAEVAELCHRVGDPMPFARGRKEVKIMNAA